MAGGRVWDEAVAEGEEAHRQNRENLVVRLTTIMQAGGADAQAVRTLDDKGREAAERMAAGVTTWGPRIRRCSDETWNQVARKLEHPTSTQQGFANLLAALVAEVGR